MDEFPAFARRTLELPIARRGPSIQLRLVLLVVAAALPALLFSVVQARTASAVERTNAEKRALQLARRIGRDLHARGLRDFTLHAETAVSLNGRKPAPMIDPSRDLLGVRDLGPRDWVLPAPAGDPPTVRLR